MKSLSLLCALCLCFPAWAAPHLQPQSSIALDQQLAATLHCLSDGNLSEARLLARQTARQFPKSDLAQLLAAELGASAAHRQVLAGTDASGRHVNKLQDLLQEARARLHERPSPASTPLPDQLPHEVVQLGKAVSALLVVDLADSSLHHLAVNAGTPTLIQQHYIGSGKAGYDKRFEGDNKTPLGVYRINGYRSDASLPDLYGAGALTLDYPNALDRYLGRTGSGIWLHGVPHDQRSRSPRSSEGCVTMANDHFNILHRRLSGDAGILNASAVPATPVAEPIVLLTHDIRWRDAASRHQEQLTFQGLFERYQRAWRQRDVDELQHLYASEELLRRQLQVSDAQEATGIMLLDSVNKGDISIFHNPSLATSEGPPADTSPGAAGDMSSQPDGNTEPDPASWPQVVMSMQLGESSEYQLTLYWGRNLQGQWQLLTEQWSNVSS